MGIRPGWTSLTVSEILYISCARPAIHVLHLLQVRANLIYSKGLESATAMLRNLCLPEAEMELEDMARAPGEHVWGRCRWKRCGRRRRGSS